MRRRSALVVAALVAAGCGDDGGPKTLPPSSQDDLHATLIDMAAFGEKGCGTAAGGQAGDYIAGRLTALKLTDVHKEDFGFPRWALEDKAMSVTIDGAETQLAFDVFEASGSGDVTGPVVDVGTATDTEVQGVDLSGKIALVTRSTSFHRSAQLKNVTGAGALAMLYLSVAPENLRQVGSVRFDWEAADLIPAVTVGAVDGKVVQDAVAAHKTVTAHITVHATSTPSTGHNIVATIPGERPEVIVLGAHYDTWFTGSSDNSSGVAELIDVASRQMQKGKPAYTLRFVAYDGEEIGLYGGYDYLRKHKIAGDEKILAVLNFESPSANNPDIAAVVHSNQPAVDDALQRAHLRQIYAVYAGLEIVAQLFGGIIPTDIQGDYRSGVPTVTTAVTNPYYHTNKDTPETVDLQLLADSADGFDTAIDYLGELQPADFDVVDPTLWTTEVATTSGAMFSVTATVRTGMGMPAANAKASAYVLVDDFMLAASATAMTDAQGKVTFELPAGAVTSGAGNRFLHVTAGPTYPLSETILALP